MIFTTSPPMPVGRKVLKNVPAKYKYNNRPKETGAPKSLIKIDQRYVRTTKPII